MRGAADILTSFVVGGLYGGYFSSQLNPLSTNNRTKGSAVGVSRLADEGEADGERRALGSERDQPGRRALEPRRLDAHECGPRLAQAQPRLYRSVAGHPLDREREALGDERRDQQASRPRLLKCEPSLDAALAIDLPCKGAQKVLRPELGAL